MARARWWALEPRTSFVTSPFIFIPCSPIGGREPAFEAGDVGSIPARGAFKTRLVAVVYWRARLAVNEEVRVQSPPVTPND